MCLNVLHVIVGTPWYHGDGNTRVKGLSQGWLHQGRVFPGLAMLGQGVPRVGYSWKSGWDGSYQV